MTPTPRRKPELLAKWIAYRDARMLRKGVTLANVASELAEIYGCWPNTVRRHLDPSYGEKHRAAGRDRYAPIKRSNQVRRYNKNYRRLTRASSQPRILAGIFDPPSEMTLEQVTEAIRAKLEDVPFQPSTIERVLREYEFGQREGMIRGPPFLYELRPGNWHYTNNRPPAHQDD